MERIRTFILDDEAMAIAIVQQHAELRDDLLIVGTATDPLDALDMIPDLDVKLIFVDMTMEGMSGPEFIKALGPSYHYICCSAYNDYVDQTSMLNVPNYILKPFKPEEFTINVDLRLASIRDQELAQKARTEEIRLKEGSLLGTIRNSKVAITIPFYTIEVLEGDSDETILYCTDAVYEVAGRLKDIETQLPVGRFLRSHRSYIVARDRVTGHQGSKALLLVDGCRLSRVPLSPTYRRQVLKDLNLKK